MRILVDGQEVPEELIRQAEQWLAHDLRWQSIRDEAERARELHAAAEQAAIERVLVEQVAARDPRPIDPKLIEQEIRRQEGQAAGRATVFDDPRVRFALELELRTPPAPGSYNIVVPPAQYTYSCPTGCP